jgi:hypothetical protein
MKGAVMKMPTGTFLKKALAQLLQFIILPYLAINLIFDLIVKGSFSGLKWDILAVMCSVGLATRFVLSKTKFR